VAKFAELRAATTEFGVRKKTAAKPARSLMNIITGHQSLIYAQHKEKKKKANNTNTIIATPQN